MEEEKAFDLATIFAAVEDPRIERTKLHRLVDILMIAVCGVICGADGWVEIEEFGKAKEAWFHSWLALPNGIPSHDTFGRVFARLDPKQFEACFLQWVHSVSEEIKGVIAVDGKTLRRSHDRAEGKKALHLVSAWASENRMVLAQLATEEQSNEITAIPALLRQLALAGCIVTIDAMGTQTQIASQIIEQEAYYALALKELQGIGMVRAERRMGQEVTREARYYLLSFPGVKTFAHAVRSHWGIENCVHWVLDMASREDESRIREGHAQENLAVLRHLTLNLLRREKTAHVGIKVKRLKAAWDTNYLQRILETVI